MPRPTAPGRLGFAVDGLGSSKRYPVAIGACCISTTRRTMNKHAENDSAHLIYSEHPSVEAVMPARIRARGGRQVRKYCERDLDGEPQMVNSLGKILSRRSGRCLSALSTNGSLVTSTTFASTYDVADACVSCIVGG
jgi:hypothetical protein